MANIWDPHRIDWSKPLNTNWWPNRGMKLMLIGAANRLGVGSTSWRSCVGSHVGTLVGSTWTGSSRGRVPFCDGIDDRVEIGTNISNLGITNSGTFSLWFNGLLTQGTASDVLSDWSSNVGANLRVYNDGKAEFFVYPGNYRATSAVGAVTANKWHHLSAVMDVSQIRVYVDGIQVASASLGGNVGSSVETLRIGQRGSFSAITQMDALVDDIRIHTRALSAAELRSICLDGNGYPNTFRRFPTPRTTRIPLLEPGGNAFLGQLDDVRFHGKALTLADHVTQFNNQNDPGAFAEAQTPQTGFIPQ